MNFSRTSLKYMNSSYTNSTSPLFESWWDWIEQLKGTKGDNGKDLPIDSCQSGGTGNPFTCSGCRYDRVNLQQHTCSVKNSDGTDQCVKIPSNVYQTTWTHDDMTHTAFVWDPNTKLEQCDKYTNITFLFLLSFSYPTTMLPNYD